MASILFLPIIFFSYTLGLYLFARYGSDKPEFLTFPTSISDLRELSTNLTDYSNDHYTYVFVLFCLVYVWKQSFAIPGSFLLNILAGSLYGVKLGLPLACFLTAVGASNCYLLSKHLARDYVVQYFGERVDALAAKINESEASSLVFLISLRLIPMTPNWFLNISFPILGVPLHSLFLSVLIGLIPYNLLCVHSGTMLADLRSTSDVIDAATMAKLFVVALLLLVPTAASSLYKRHLAAKAR